jgi:hypothetical protein
MNEPPKGLPARIPEDLREAGLHGPNFPQGGSRNWMWGTLARDYLVPTASDRVPNLSASSPTSCSLAVGSGSSPSCGCTTEQNL